MWDMRAKLRNEWNQNSISKYLNYLVLIYRRLRSTGIWNDCNFNIKMRRCFGDIPQIIPTNAIYEDVRRSLLWFTKFPAARCTWMECIIPHRLLQLSCNSVTRATVLQIDRRNEVFFRGVHLNQRRRLLEYNHKYHTLHILVHVLWNQWSNVRHCPPLLLNHYLLLLFNQRAYCPACFPAWEKRIFVREKRFLVWRNRISL